jgi:cell division protein FtsQ
VSTDTLSRGGARTTPLIDPRLRDRRIEVARTEGRRRLRRFVVLAVIVLLVAGAVATAHSPLLDVDRIEVRGIEGAAADDVRAATGISLGTPLVRLDPAAAAEQVEALPWVEQAAVERSWPGTLVVRVTERVPVAVVGPSGRPQLVDAEGRVLGPADASSSALPSIDGRAAEAGATLSERQVVVADVLGGLPAGLRSEVVEARGERSGIVLELTDGVVVRWGDATQQTAKRDALRVLLDQGDRATFATIDVSVPRASTVTFRSTAAE